MPARLSASAADRVKVVAARVYRILACQGFARVDLFYTPEGEIVFHEVNTIPGFTGPQPLSPHDAGGGLEPETGADRSHRFGPGRRGLRGGVSFAAMVGGLFPRGQSKCLLALVFLAQPHKAEVAARRANPVPQPHGRTATGVMWALKRRLAGGRGSRTVCMAFISPALPASAAIAAFIRMSQSAKSGAPRRALATAA